MIYIIADTHFSHNNIIKYCNRPYANINDMNMDIVEKWNSVVQPNDIVFHLGDVGFGLKEKLLPLVTRLNGYKFLLRGNHDYSRGIFYWSELRFENVYKKGEITLEQFLNDIAYLEDEEAKNFVGNLDHVIFSHYPIECNDEILNIHGHIHNIPLDTTKYNPDNHYCVSVEMIDYTPKTLRSILAEKL